MIASMAICLAFFLLGLVNLGQPQVLYYDETWYVPAVAKMLNGLELINREHPPLGKELMAFFYWAFGGSWVSARIGSLVFGAIGLYGFQRAHFYLTRSFWSTVMFGVLVATNCLYFTTSRAALLDPYMLGFAGMALACFTRGMVVESRQIRSFFLAGISIGLAMACKWTIAPLAVFMACAAIVRFRFDWKRLAILGTSAAVPAFAVYAITFIPFLFTTIHPLEVSDFFPLQRAMAYNLGVFVADHPYQSQWWQWPLGQGQMLFFEGEAVGDNRVILLGQNPISAFLVGPAIVAGAIISIKYLNYGLGVSVFAFLISWGFWGIGHKPNLFLYHYNLPLIFSISVMAQIAVMLRNSAFQIASVILIAMQVMSLAYFWPVVTGATTNRKVEKISEDYGWRKNSVGRDKNGISEESKIISAWATRCLGSPSRAECSRHPRNKK